MLDNEILTLGIIVLYIIRIYFWQEEKPLKAPNRDQTLHKRNKILLLCHDPSFPDIVVNLVLLVQPRFRGVDNFNKL